MITVRGLNRSLRHGFDGRFEPTESLACRLSGDSVTELSGLVDGADLIEGGIEHGGVPDDVADLLVETVLEDPDPKWTDRLSGYISDSKGLAPQLVSARLDGERRLHLHTQRAGSDTGRLMVGFAARRRAGLPGCVHPVQAGLGSAVPRMASRTRY